MNTKSCFAPAHILLPSEQIPLESGAALPAISSPVTGITGRKPRLPRQAAQAP